MKAEIFKIIAIHIKIQFHIKNIKYESIHMDGMQ